MIKQKEKIDYNQAREELRKWLVKYTGCEIQNGKDGKAYPCGTCLLNLLEKIGLSDCKEYKEHNKPVDRQNEVWRAILQIRDAKIK